MTTKHERLSPPPPEQPGGEPMTTEHPEEVLRQLTIDCGSAREEAALSALTTERDDAIHSFRLASQARDKWRDDHDKMQVERNHLRQHHDQFHPGPCLSPPPTEQPGDDE